MTTDAHGHFHSLNVGRAPLLVTGIPSCEITVPEGRNRPRLGANSAALGPCRWRAVITPLPWVVSKGSGGWTVVASPGWHQLESRSTLKPNFWWFCSASSGFSCPVSSFLSLPRVTHVRQAPAPSSARTWLHRGCAKVREASFQASLHTPSYINHRIRWRQELEEASTCSPLPTTTSGKKKAV